MPPSYDAGGFRASLYYARLSNLMRQLPYLLPWVRVLLLIRSITSTEWDDTTGRLVQPLLRRALEMRRQIAREGWWN